ncbi:UNVERIFIED_CONTAM: hypothetical protein Sindi_3044600 [Sesamum indicum]
MLSIETQTAIRKAMLPNLAPKPSNRAGKKVAEEVGRGKAVAKETGESSKMMDQPAKDPRYQTEHKN